MSDRRPGRKCKGCFTTMANDLAVVEKLCGTTCVTQGFQAPKITAEDQILNRSAGQVQSVRDALLRQEPMVLESILSRATASSMKKSDQVNIA